MFIAINIGNTHVSLGLFKGRTLVRVQKIQTDRARTGQACARELRQLTGRTNAVHGIAGASVVPSTSPVWDRACRELFQYRPAWINGRTKMRIKVRTHHPLRTGADRIANAAAAWDLARGPVIVVDIGTAINVEAVNRHGEFLGGAITAGAGLMARALHDGTAQLPLVRTGLPSHFLGRNTAESIRSGLYAGTIGQVREIVKRIKREMGGSASVIGTGGMAPFLKKEGLFDLVDEHLTLKGIRIIGEDKFKVKS